MDKRWVINEPGDEETIESLSQALVVDKVIANLLVQRGIKTFEEAKPTQTVIAEFLQNHLFQEFHKVRTLLK